MPHGNDEPRDLKSRLSHFNLFESTPRKSIEPRDPIIGGIQPIGSLKPVHGFKAPGILGWEDIFNKNEINCRFDGTRMYFHHETDMEILYACPYPMCENNPNTPDAIKEYKKKRRSMNTHEKQF